MRLSRIFTTAIAAIALLLPSMSRAEDSIYVVKPTDTLSEIAHTFFGAPVYKGGGTLARLLSLNPQIKNPNRIKIGQEIHMDAMAKVAGEFRRAEAARNVASEVAEKVCVAPEELAFKVTSSVSIALGFEYFRVDSTDLNNKGNASIVSRMSPSVTAAWKLDWSPEWSSKLSLRVRSEDAQGIVGSSKTLGDAKGKSYGFGMEVERHWNKDSTSHFALRRQEEIFLYSPTTSTVNLERVGVFSAVIGHEQRLVHVQTASLGIGAEAAYLFSAQGLNYDVNSGLLGKGYAFMEHQRDGVSLRGEAFYQYQKQNTSITNQSETTLGLAIGLIWKLP